MPPTTSIAIIGTAGSRGSHVRLSRALFESMCERARVELTQFGLKPSEICLVSGGAAWSDHVAVRLFLLGDVAELKLHFPAPWTGTRFATTDSGWHDAGRIMNHAHSVFSQALGDDSLSELATALQSGAVSTVHHGFSACCSAVAQVSLLLAFSFSEGSAPLDGGTAKTWARCKGRRVHLSLPSLKSSR